jgi:predicted AAA+ superfamily ATPase
MAHRRKRYLAPLIKNGLAHKGILGIFGHRQVGKTTLLEMFAGQYTTLDRTFDLNRANENPSAFLNGFYESSSETPIAIDECQLAPPLFPELKEFVRVHKEPGLFLLSGSVRFSSRKAIRESLTGRLLTYELLPFSISELSGKPVNRLALDLMTCQSISGIDLKKYKAVGVAHNPLVLKYLKAGGLPGLCFIRSPRDYKDLLDSQLNLILDRDLRLVCDTNLPLSRLLILVQLMAQNQNAPLNLAEIARKTRISQPTLRKILAGLEAIFFLRMVRCEGTESRPVYFFEDQGEAHYLAGGRYDALDDLVRLSYAHLRVPFAYEPGFSFECFQYRMQGGASVPLCYRSGRDVIGFICSLDESPSLSAIRSAGSFQKKYPGAKIIHLHPGKKVTVLSTKEASLPVEFFL